MKLKLIDSDYHRNGISGAPFVVSLFKNGKDTMLGIDFGGEYFATFDAAKLAAGDIQFGSNSWQGDEFGRAVRNLPGYERLCEED